MAVWFFYFVAYNQPSFNKINYKLYKDGRKMKDILIDKIENKSLKTAVIGLGYVGLPLAVELAKTGYTTVGFDIDSHRVDMVNKSISYIDDVDSLELSNLVSEKSLLATGDFSMLNQMDFIAIAVPTPLDNRGQPNTSHLVKACKTIANHLTPNTIIVLESTSYPKTTRELILPLLEEGSNLSCGRDFYLGFSPERIDPSNKSYNTSNTPKLVSGICSDSKYIITLLYKSIITADIIPVATTEIAEMAKLLENSYRSVNIALVNDLAKLCHLMDIDIWQVIKAAKTKPYGFTAFYPGVGVGGHCVPVDPSYLSWKALEYGHYSSILSCSSEINTSMPMYCLERITALLNQNEKSIKSSKILLLGIAYKENIADYRESPAIKLLQLIEDYQGSVDYFDPLVKSFNKGNKEYYSVDKLTPLLLCSYDMVVITTAHSNLDYSMVCKYSKLIFDSRNALDNLPHCGNVHPL